VANSPSPLSEPNAQDAEKAVLGIALLHPNAAQEAVRLLQPDNYYLPAHQTIHQAIMALTDKRLPVDPVSVWHEIEAMGATRAVPDGVLYLHDLVSNSPGVGSQAYHITLIQNAAARRRINSLGMMAQALANDASTGIPSDIIDSLRGSLDNITATYVDTSIPTFEAGLEETLAEIERVGTQGAIVGVPTGFPDLDAKMHGMRPGQMIIIAGRPAMGKSTLMLNFAAHAAFHCDKSVLIFSLEMSRIELLSKLLSAEARIEWSTLQSGKLSEAEWSRLASIHSKISKARFGVDDTPNVTMPDIRAKAMKWKAQHGLDMVAIDYLQLMSSGRRTENRQQEVSEMSRNVKLLAKELGVPVLALSQLNRGPEQRTEKKPQLSDLRESGSLEQDCDVAILLHRDEVYNPTLRVGEADIIVAKHRGGPTGITPAVAQLHYSRFVPAAFSLDPNDGDSPNAF